MCREDVMIGLRRWSKNTALFVGTLVFPRNSKRVLLRVALYGDNIVSAIVNGRPEPFSGNSAIIIANGGRPSDEVWLERHGNMVMDQWLITSNANAIITEVFDDFLAVPTPGDDPYSQPGVYQVPVGKG